MSATPEPPATPTPGLLRLASQLAGPADADDLVQATCVRALEHGDSVHARASWLRTVMRNEQWMTVRARKRRDAREREVEPAPAVDVEHVVHCLQVARLVQDLLDALDDELAMVVRERYFEDRSAAEIAAHHGIPAGTVRWRLKVALDRLRGELDAHHGGERMLWAGAFAPTVGMPAASLPSTAGDATAAVKGSSMMSIKILLAATAIAATGVTATYVTRASTTTSTQQPAASHDVADETMTPRAEARAAKREADKAKWSHRLAQIHAAHREQSDAPSPPFAAQTSTAKEAIWEQRVGECDEPGCRSRLTSEVLGMVDGCDELMGDTPHDAMIEAKIVGAPDIGTIIESVELKGGADMSPELRECLTESMYAVDLGATDRSFSQTMTLVMGGVSVTVDALANEDLDPASRARLEAVFAENDDDPRPVQMIMISEPDEPTPQ